MKPASVCSYAVLLAGLFVPQAHAGDVQLFECVAQKRLAGREEATPASSQSRMPDGQPRNMEVGDPGYTSTEKGKPIPEWIDLFGAQNGHASSFLGFYLSKDFECTAIEG